MGLIVGRRFAAPAGLPGVGLWLILWFGLWTGACGRMAGAPVTESKAGSEAVPNFALLDHDGRFRELHYHRDAKAIVLVVHGSACPIVRGSLPTLDALMTRFGPRGAVFWMINANPQDHREAIAAEAEAWNIEMPILVDDAQLVASRLGLGRTGEVLVIDPGTWRIVYRGGLDDRLDYEAQRAEARKRPVARLLEAMVDEDVGELPAVEALPVRGCLILDTDAQSPTPDFAEDVAPILIRRCAACHRPGGVGPWAMTDHATVRGWSPMIREVIETRRMPPWHADPHVGRFAGDLALEADEARTVVRWIADGAPRGGGSDPLVDAVTPVTGNWPLGEPDLIFDLPTQQIPATGLLDYRYVDLEMPEGRELHVSGVDLRPSNRTVLHHALAHVIYPPGHPKADEHWQNEMFAGYAPGIDPHPFPSGTGRRVPLGAKVRIELHYITTGRPESDAPRLGVYLSDRPAPFELHTRGPANTRFRIPPGDGDHRVEARVVFPEDATLYAFLPHMHYRGSWVRYQARFPDGRTELLASVPSYRFTWQRYYVLAEPRFLPAGTEIIVTGAFDNSSRNPRNPDPTQTVTWGPQSTDEMFIGYMEYAFRPPPAARRSEPLTGR